MTAVPQGWRILPISDVLARLPTGKVVQQGWSPQCESVPAGEGDWGVLKTTAIQFGQFDDTQHKRLPDSIAPRPALEVSKGDLLLTNAGPRSRCAVPCLVRHTRSRLMLSGKIYRFRADAGVIDPRFLELYLLGSDAQLALDKMKTGISDSGLNLTNGRFLTTPVVVPPIEDQERIVDILEDQLSRLEAASSYLSASKTRVQALLASWSRENLLFGSEIAMSTVGEQMIDIKGGWSRSRAHVTTDRRVGVPYLKMNHILNEGGLNLVDVPLVTGPAADVERFSVRPGDVLFNSKNSAELVGKVALVPSAVNGWTYNENIMRIRFNSGVRPEFAAVWMSSPIFRRHVAGEISASTSVAAIYMRQLRELPMPVPALNEQDRLVAAYDALTARVEGLRGSVATAELRRNSLRRSLLQAAFSGRLPGWDSDDERIAGPME